MTAPQVLSHLKGLETKCKAAQVEQAQITAQDALDNPVLLQ
jgi:hypothetical protein